MLSGDELETTLDDLGLGDTERTWIDSGPGTDTDLLVVGFDPEQGPWLSQWQRLRDAVEMTGRWPLAVEADPARPADKLSRDLRFFFNDATSTAASYLSAGLAAPYPNDVADNYDYWEIDGDDPLSLINAMVIDPGVVAALRVEAATSIDTASADEVVRFVLAKHLEASIAHRVGSDTRWLGVSGEPTGVLLCPDNHPAHSVAYAASFDTPRAELAIPILRRWVDDHDLEVIGAVSCSILMRMAAPLGDPADALRMAKEVMVLGDCSFGGIPAGVGAPEVAAELVSSTLVEITIYP